MDYPIRINKYLAQQNICSRREADGLVREGKVKINGQKAVLGDVVQEGDDVRVLRNTRALFYYAFNKPRGIITHSPQQGEKSIQDIIKTPVPVYPLGRLDKDSRGLILLTNDGRVTGKLLSPELEHEKEYEVKVDRPLSKDFVRLMTEGVALDDGYVTKKCSVRQLSKFSFAIILTEGKKHQIRRMAMAFGYKVVDLRRVRVMNILLGDLPPGKLRPIVGKELQAFMKQLKIV